ncbi:TolC family protein, partial [Brevibacillus reuszeri]|uniref:TolC family protein n=1 Tax=Brevibacillus reuszeri TaxID=54915 RepID=UPI002897DB0A
LFYERSATKWSRIRLAFTEIEKMNRANFYALYSIYQSYEDGYKLLQTSKRAVKLASENYTKMITQYKQGLLGTAEVLQAEQDLAHLENQYVEAEHSFNQVKLNFQ